MSEAFPTWQPLRERAAVTYSVAQAHTLESKRVAGDGLQARAPRGCELLLENEISNIKKGTLIS